MLRRRNCKPSPLMVCRRAFGSRVRMTPGQHDRAQLEVSNTRVCGKDYVGFNLDHLVPFTFFDVMYVGCLWIGSTVVKPKHGIVKGTPSALGMARVW